MKWSQFLIFALFFLIGAGCMPAKQEEAIISGIDEELLPIDEGGVIQVFVSDPNAVVAEPALAEDGVLQVELTVSEDGFFPNQIPVHASQKLRILFSSVEGVHTFTIDDIGLQVPISEGDSTMFTAPSKPGKYAFYCSIGNHRDIGMVGVLDVVKGE